MSMSFIERLKFIYTLSPHFRLLTHAGCFSQRFPKMIINAWISQWMPIEWRTRKKKYRRNLLIISGMKCVSVVCTGIEPVLPEWKSGVLTPRRTDRFWEKCRKDRFPSGICKKQTLYIYLSLPFFPRAQTFAVTLTVNSRDSWKSRLVLVAASFIFAAPAEARTSA